MTVEQTDDQDGDLDWLSPTRRKILGSISNEVMRPSCRRAGMFIKPSNVVRVESHDSSPVRSTPLKR